MLMLRRRCTPPRVPDAQLVLPFELRQRSRLRATLDSGEEVGLMLEGLERGGVLRDGDLLEGDDGRVVRVRACPEEVLHVTCARAEDLARVAYHVGNRHVPLQVGSGWLRLGADPVLRQMLEGLGATVETLSAPFEPEAGAYGHSHALAPGARVAR